MIAYRLVHQRSLAATGHPLITRGAPGRWNSEGVRLTYSSESVALAALELLGYWNSYPTLNGYQLYQLEFSEAQITLAKTDIDVHDHVQTRPYGDAWAAQKRSLVLQVPSAVLPLSTNFVINQRHPDFGSVNFKALGAFEYDGRVASLLQQARTPS